MCKNLLREPSKVVASKKPLSFDISCGRKRPAATTLALIFNRGNSSFGGPSAVEHGQLRQNVPVKRAGKILNVLRRIQWGDGESGIWLSSIFGEVLRSSYIQKEA